MNWENYQEYELNGVKATLILNTKCHKWQIWFNWRGTREEAKQPHLEFSQAKGQSIIDFLKRLRKVQNADSK